MDPFTWPSKTGRPARTYIQELYEDTGCSPEELPEVMNDREGGERGSGISVMMARQDDDDIYKVRIKNLNENFCAAEKAN